MNVRVRFFASIRQKLRRDDLECSLAAGATVHDLLDHLCRDFPALVDMRRSVSTAVNREYADADHVLADGDEVALIPPVSGGRRV
ncbi:MAG TPA: molybdopterin converting factor subunit 1 [Candidatus Binatia bacterium]|nr:molybdopterin converting factor subunit 1 [Candidatus Binatia bacterium]